MSIYIQLILIILIPSPTIFSTGYHNGAIWDLDPDFESKYLLTACADGSARMFEVTTGKYMARMPHKGAVRSVKWGDGRKYFATASDPFTSRDLGCITIFEFPSEDKLFEAPASSARKEDPAKLHSHLLQIFVDDNDKCICLGWTIADQYIIAGFDSGHIIKYDATTGKEVARVKAHDDRVNRISFNRDKSMFITASKDCTAKLMDPNTLEVIRNFRTDRPVNGAAISPTHPHILLGGGQDAQNVTTTSSSQGKFETRFFHAIYGEEFARVRGHFGPINCLDVHPFGKSYASGAEDG